MTNQPVWRPWLKNDLMLLDYSHYKRIIGQYFYFASTCQVFFRPFEDKNQFNYNIDGVVPEIESPF